MLLIAAFRRLRRSRDQGSALIAVLGVMVIGLTLTTMVASSVVSAYRFSTSTRAGVQAHATADAGIAAARAGLYVAGNCAGQPVPGTYSSTGSVAYTATVQFDAGSGWQAGCPNSTTSRIRIVSIGKPQGTAGNTRQVETILNWLVPGPKPSGTAADFYGGATIEANSSFDLSESAGLVIQNGSLICSKPNSVFNGNLVVNGALDISKGCTVNGNVTVSGLATLGSGTIKGTLTAGSISPSNPSLTQVTGGYTISPAPVTTPPWVDVPYNPGAWLDSSGNPYQVFTAPTGTPCALTSGNLGDPTGKPVILDLRSCVGGPTATNNTTLALTSDVVIFANQFNFGNINSLAFTSSSSAVHRLWFITPDTVADQKPTCAANEGPFIGKNNLVASDVLSTSNAIQAMLYTPCDLQMNNNFTWNGQLYIGGATTIVNNPVFTFTPVGIAGYDLSTGAPVPPILSPQPGTLISNRDLAGG